MNIKLYQVLYTNYKIKTIVELYIQKINIIKECIRWYLFDKNVEILYNNSRVRISSWYWTWSESSIFDFIVSTFLHRLLNVISLVLLFTSIIGLIEFSLYFRATNLLQPLLSTYRLYGSKYVILMVISVWMFFISFLITVL